MILLKSFASIRNLVLAIILYVGWLGILVMVVPFVVYKKIRRMGGNVLQAFFLAVVSCFFYSWLTSLGELNRPREFFQVHLDFQFLEADTMAAHGSSVRGKSEL